MKVFLFGRKNVFEILKNKIAPTDKTLWFHCASLGEFEQGLPIMEALKRQFPEHKIVVSFFSPSGFEHKKNVPIADAVVYLPLDTPANAQRFIQIVHPEMAFFVKYEFWPNYLFELKKNGIPTFLVSGLFRSDQVFFKWYGGFMKTALKSITHFFVQNKDSENLLKEIGFNNVSISGDTRFDRVFKQTETQNTLIFIEKFIGKSLCIVCGSTWPEDEALLLPFINESGNDVKFIMAPHKIDGLKIETFRNRLKKPSILFSKKEGHNLTEFPILIVDAIGLLTKIYSYANVAYVGGAAGKTGLHNILEPAAFGVPIVIGKNHEKFPEANQLVKMKGAFSVKNASECTQILSRLTEDSNFRNSAGTLPSQYILNNRGATEHIIGFIKNVNNTEV